MVIGIRYVSRIHFSHANEQLLLVIGERIPRANPVELWPRLAIWTRDLRLPVRVDRRQHGVLHQYAKLLLVRQDTLPDRFIAHIELAFVLVSPLLEDVVRGVAAARAEVHKPRLIRCDNLGISDELDRLVSQVLGEVIARFGLVWLIDEMVIVGKGGVPLIRLGA